MGRLRHPPRYRLLLPLLLPLARAAVFWERLWPRLWPLVAVGGVFLSIALLDLLPRLPGWLHALVLAGFAVGLIAAGRYAASGFQAVTTRRARHRLELDSGLHHRPLTSLGDPLAGGAGDPAAEALWQAHLGRMHQTIRRLRLRLPAPGLARRDPYAFRAAVLFFLVIALTAGRGDAAGRLERALVPNFGAAGDNAVVVEVWITPPAYTRTAPLFLGTARTDAAHEEPSGISVPAGSTLLAQVSGAHTPPVLIVGTQTSAFKTMGAESVHRAETVIETGDRLAVELDGRRLAQWRLRVARDHAPEVVFMAPPTRTRRSHLRFDYEAGDDYGVIGVMAVIRLRDGDPGAGTHPPLRLVLPVPGTAAQPGSAPARESSIQDLTAHPWAGLPVEIYLTAKDHRGQEGQSGVVSMALPERIFNHPVARAIIDARRMLVAPTDAVRADVRKALDDISNRPRHFFGDPVVFLALRVARARLLYSGRTPASVASVQGLLWDTALRIEDGELSLAERDLKDAQKRLMAALEKQAGSEELERLMNELDQALDKYLAALQKEMKRKGIREAPLDPSTMETIESGELRRMIEEARMLARTGSLEAARRMIAQLQKMLDRIASGLESGKPREDVMKALKLMDGLRGLTQDQQRLLDETFRRSQRTLRPGQTPDRQEAERSGAQQQTLRKKLGNLMRQLDGILGNIPRPLGKAERAMRDAAEELGRGHPGAAVPSQSEAVDQLRQATDSVGEQIARRLGGLSGRQAGQKGRRPGPGRDPFGRRAGGAFGAALDGSTKVPDGAELQRAGEIVRELRRRSGQLHRSKQERDYINRLLRRF